MLIKNKIVLVILIILNFLIINFEIAAEELDIAASEIVFDEGKNMLIAKKSVIIVDSKGNKVLTEKAEYYKSTDLFFVYL